MDLGVFKILDIILVVFLGSGTIAMVVATIRFITGSDRYSGKVSTDNTTEDRQPGCQPDCFDENDPIHPGW